MPKPPSDLIEAELFGAEAGAFTGAKTTRIGRFEAADGGTLFLDEIGNLSLDGQMKLLRVLQSGEFERVGSTQTRKVSVRVISATNADLRSDIQQGRFREDLYYRLNVIELAVPPLCQRQDDIPALIAHFLPGRELSPHAEQALRHHSWPGNVRELENACKRIAVLKPQGELQADDFALQSVEQAQMQKHEPSKQDIEHSMRLHQGGWPKWHGILVYRDKRCIGVCRNLVLNTNGPVNLPTSRLTWQLSSWLSLFVCAPVVAGVLLGLLSVLQALLLAVMLGALQAMFIHYVVTPRVKGLQAIESGLLNFKDGDFSTSLAYNKMMSWVICVGFTMTPRANYIRSGNGYTNEN